jgi:hypothetical protein
MGIRRAAVAAGSVAVATGSAAIKKVLAQAPSGWGAPGGTAQHDPQRWRAVTVDRPIQELEGGVPGPLAELGDAVEVRLRQAPGDKGTELQARLTRTGHDPINGQDPLEALRSALRKAKQVAEVGYVLEPDPTATKRTPLNEPLRQATKHAGGEGRL